MSQCNLAKQCFFFAVRDEGQEMHEYLTGLYCAGNFTDCARYRAALEMGQELVPDDIFPNEDDFVSLFAWAWNLRGNPASKPCPPDRWSISAQEKAAASSSHLSPSRQTRRQH